MMTSRTFHAAALAAFLALAAPFAVHAAVEQVADIYPEPGETRGSISNPPQVFKSDDGVLFFTADTGSDGRELWVTDGTAAGTHQLTDSPGDRSTFIDSATFLGDELYFTASIGTGLAIWKTDGTVAGTQKVYAPIFHSLEGGDLFALTAANGKLYFDVVADGQFSVWVSDGTTAGTRKIKTIGAYQHHFDDYYFAPAGGKVVFTADDGTHGLEPWVTNGTDAGTVMLEDIRGGEGSKPRDFVAWGDKTLFTTFVGSLFFTDGSGVTAINATDGAATGNTADNVTVAGSGVYFTARTFVSGASKGSHLWYADGSGADATLVDPGSATEQRTVDNLAADGSDLYFTVSTSANETLYKWDGTTRTPVLDAGADTIDDVVYADGKLYFTRTGSVSGLFVYDGTSVQPLGDVDVRATAASDGKLFLGADDGAHGYEPWVSDGTPAGTRMIENLAGPDAGSDPDDITVVGGKLLFSACEPDHRCEPWISDGTAAGTRLLQDIAPGPDESYPEEFTAVGDTVYFAAINGSGDDLLWKVAEDGSGATSVGAGFDDPEDLVAFNGELYFAAWTPSTDGYSLWKSDGAPAGTVRVNDLDLYFLTVAGDKLFYGAEGPGDTDPQLWVSDGTGAGAKELTSGLDDIDFGEFAAVGGKLYFIADDGAHVDEVWVSDGTVAGTHRVKDATPGADDSDPYGLTAYDGYLYFGAFTDAAGYELWRTDGTAAGTKLFADLNPGAPSSDPYELTVAGGKLYFNAHTPAAGEELWVTDGGKPVQVKDISPGAKGSEPVDLTAIGNRVVFTASDGVNGSEPWISDGTAAGTRPIGDVNAGADSSNPYGYVLLKRQLFFAANDGATGDELWRADINRRPVAIDAAITTDSETAYSGKLKASDPDGDALTFGVADAPAHGKVEITDATTGAFTYTPADGYSGKDSFTFKADDGLGSSIATVSIQVKGDSTPPDDDTTPPTGNGDGDGDGDVDGDGDGGSRGSGGGGALGFLGGLLLLGALSRKRIQKRSGP